MCYAYGNVVTGVLCVPVRYVVYTMCSGMLFILCVPVCCLYYVYRYVVICILQGKSKSDKNRQRVQESYHKLAHQQRTELAQQRREDKLKAETEKYMNEEDPVKARKLEV